MKTHQIFKLFAASAVLSTGGGLFFWNDIRVKAETVGDLPVDHHQEEEVCDVAPLSPQPTVAVIGAGIGGSSATHFLR